ncbi:MAG: DUF3656 domain-containing protein [Lachnospiraceae bacterium]|nr:DUF3656 domain-containing protein [Lachnospiraceae bacterium]
MPIYRTRNESLINEIQKETIDIEIKENLKGNIRFEIGKSAMIRLAYKDLSVTVEGDIVMEAEKAPVTKEKLLGRLLKTGNTPFTLEIDEVVMDKNAFLPMGAINALRRDALLAMEEVIISRGYRKEFDLPVKNNPVKQKDTDTCFEKRIQEENICYATTLEQAKAAMKIPDVAAIYLQAESLPFDKWDDFSKRCHEYGKEIYYSLPLVFHKKAREEYRNHKELLCLGQQDGLLIHTLDEYAMLHFMDYRKKLVLDSSLYVYHKSSLDFYKKHVNCPVRCILPVELNDEELKKLHIKDADMVVYGRQPLMISAQCQVKNHMGCQKKGELLFLKDRRDVRFPVKNFCKYCYNVIYNGACLNLLDYEEERKKINAYGCIYRFTIETGDEVKDILSGRLPNQKYTKGHFKRGIE